MTCAANASLISTRSMSLIDMPARARARWLAATGPYPMISGERAVTPVATTRARGRTPSAWALRSLMITRAAAPSLSGQALPGVTVPSGRNTGLRLAIASTVTPARGPSSLSTTRPSGNVTGTISRAKKPSAIAFSARFCDRQPNSSCSWRPTPFSSARFSAVWPIAM